MKILMAVISLTGALLFVSACATDRSRLDQKIASETEIESRRDLQVEADYLIQTSKTLSEVQKTSLLELRRSAKNQMDDLEREAIKLRAVLLRAVLSEKLNHREVESIKARMKQVENQKMARVFETVDQANKIIGRQKFDSAAEFFTDFFVFDTVRVSH